MREDLRLDRTTAGGLARSDSATASGYAFDLADLTVSTSAGFSIENLISLFGFRCDFFGVWPSTAPMSEMSCTLLSVRGLIPSKEITSINDFSSKASLIAASAAGGSGTPSSVKLASLVIPRLETGSIRMGTNPVWPAPSISIPSGAHRYVAARVSFSVSSSCTEFFCWVLAMRFSGLDEFTGQGM